MTPKPCDTKFNEVNDAYGRAAEKLFGASNQCIRQAISDLVRACRLFSDDDVASLKARLAESLKKTGWDNENIRDACHDFTTPRRGDLNHRDPRPGDLLVIAALNLEEACDHVMSRDWCDMREVGPLTVMSRVASEKLLALK